MREVTWFRDVSASVLYSRSGLICLQSAVLEVLQPACSNPGAQRGPLGRYTRANSRKREHSGHLGELRVGSRTNQQPAGLVALSQCMLAHPRMLSHAVTESILAPLESVGNIPLLAAIAARGEIPQISDLSALVEAVRRYARYARTISGVHELAPEATPQHQLECARSAERAKPPQYGA